MGFSGKKTAAKTKKIFHQNVNYSKQHKGKKVKDVRKNSYFV